MRSVACVLLAVVCACAAQVSSPPGYLNRYPNAKIFRHRRDMTWSRPVGGGNVFGTLGGNDMSLYGKAGYNRDFFNDHRGKLSGQAYGSRVLSPAGDSTSYGSRLDWANRNAQATVDLQKQMHGDAMLRAHGSGVWDVGKNTHVSAGAGLEQNLRGGRPNVEGRAQITHEW